MNHFHKAWEQEYQNPQFLSLGTEPLSRIKDFVRWLRRDRHCNLKTATVLDLGCGNGKNLAYFFDQGIVSGIGYDISKTALEYAKNLLKEQNVDLCHQSIGELFSLPDLSVDIIIDSTSSHVLSSSEKNIYHQEIARVLKPGGFLFVRTLCKEGDRNALYLLREFPGNEPNTYILPGIGIQERVTTREQFIRDYQQNFDTCVISKSSGYQKWGNRSYKRNYLIGYFIKK